MQKVERLDPYDTEFPKEGATLVKWFGEWPTFKDGEILALHLERDAESYLDVVTGLYGPLDPATGFFRREKKCVVRVVMRRIFETDLSGFGQNVVFGITFHAIEERSSAPPFCPSGWEVYLHPTVGLHGRICCEEIDFEITPGAPKHHVPNKTGMSSREHR